MRSLGFVGVLAVVAASAAACNAILGNSEHPTDQDSGRSGDATTGADGGSQTDVAPDQTSIDSANVDATSTDSPDRDAGVSDESSAADRADDAQQADARGEGTGVETGADEGAPQESGVGDAEGGCGAGFVTCDGGCTLLTADPRNCGACGNDCSLLMNVSSAGLACRGGSCSYGCAPGYADCADSGTGCATSLQSSTHCGSCDIGCSGATPACTSVDGGPYACVTGCSNGQSNCGGACADLMTDNAHCGSCSMSCSSPRQCQGGMCQCTGGQSWCTNACVNLQTDPNNCGVCGMVCSNVDQCTAGTCKPICNPTSCPGGCCNGAMCELYANQSSASCGSSGATCASCPVPADVCQSGICGPPPTWCGTQTIPAGVAAADYQCVDFDTGLPSTGTWVQTQAQGGTLALSTMLADSSPDSMSTSVPAAADSTTSGTSSLAWTDVGGTAVTGATVTAAVNPVAIGGVLPPWSGDIALLCVTFNASPSSYACLQYTINASSAPELDIHYVLINGAAVQNTCVAAGTFSPGLWNPVSISWTQNGPAATVSGTTTTCDAYGPPPTTSVTTTVGLAASSVTSMSWSAYYDNVVAYVQR